MSSFVHYFMVFIQVIVGLMLIGIILIQKSKGQGMGTAFGGGMGESLFGSQVGNVLTKITVVLALIFMVNSTFLAFMKSSGRRRDISVTDRIDAPAATPAPSPAPQPAAPAPQDAPDWDQAGDVPSMELPLDEGSVEGAPRQPDEPLVIMPPEPVQPADDPSEADSE